MNDHFGDLFRITKKTDATERMGVFDMLDMVRENTWKAGIEQKENRLEKVKLLAGDFVKWVLITACFAVMGNCWRKTNFIAS